MARVTIVFGLMLCAATLFALLNIQEGRVTSAFVPLVFGIPIFICGIISLNPHRLRFWVAVAGFVSAIGASGSLARLVIVLLRWSRGGEIYPLPFTITIALAIVLSLYTILAFQSLRHQSSK